MGACGESLLSQHSLLPGAIPAHVLSPPESSTDCQEVEATWGGRECGYICPQLGPTALCKWELMAPWVTSHPT